MLLLLLLLWGCGAVHVHGVGRVPREEGRLIEPEPDEGGRWRWRWRWR